MRAGEKGRHSGPRRSAVIAFAWPTRLAWRRVPQDYSGSTHRAPTMTNRKKNMPFDVETLPVVAEELSVLDELVPLRGLNIVELGCGAAAMARDLVKRHPDCRVTGLEVDGVQHAKNLAAPQDGLTFVEAGAQAIPFPAASFDLAIMLKSLHHVPMALLPQALGEAARVLKPGGYLYVSEPMYAGPFNDLIKHYNDEGVVRAAAQRALDTALATTGNWEAVAERQFALRGTFKNFDEFVKKQMFPSFADHKIDQPMIEKVRADFMPHMKAEGATFTRPLHIRLFRRTAV